VGRVGIEKRRNLGCVFVLIEKWVGWDEKRERGCGFLFYDLSLFFLSLEFFFKALINFL